jgi:hypothetical protein
VYWRRLFLLCAFSFGKRNGASTRRPNECFVLEPSEMLVVSCSISLCPISYLRGSNSRKKIIFTQVVKVNNWYWNGNSWEGSYQKVLKFGTRAFALLVVIFCCALRMRKVQVGDIYKLAFLWWFKFFILFFLKTNLKITIFNLPYTTLIVINSASDST